MKNLLNILIFQLVGTRKIGNQTEFVAIKEMKTSFGDDIDNDWNDEIKTYQSIGTHGKSSHP